MLCDFLLLGFAVFVGFSLSAQLFGSCWAESGWKPSLKQLSWWTEALVFIPGALWAIEYFLENLSPFFFFKFMLMYQENKQSAHVLRKRTVTGHFECCILVFNSHET